MTLAPNWQARFDEDCTTLTNPDGVGALQVSSARKDTLIEHADILGFAHDGVRSDDILEPCVFGDFAGLTCVFERDATHWHHWFLARGTLLLFITYNCEPRDRDVDIAAIPSMLSTLVCHDVS